MSLVLQLSDSYNYLKLFSSVFEYILTLPGVLLIPTLSSIRDKFETYENATKSFTG